MTIELATQDDFETILAWLAAEAAAGDQTFHGNRNLIAKGQEEGELFALREGGKIVAFALGKPGEIAIQETRPDQRGKGYGRILAQWGIDRARNANIVVIEGECSPPTSLGFWKTVGFREMRPRYGHNPWVYLALPKPLPVPAGEPVEVLIRVFDQAHLYHNDVSVISEHRPSAARDADDVIHLAERIVIYVPDLPMGHDVSLEIVVNGERRFFDKAKRSEAAALGVKRDANYKFYIDRIFPNA
jgi:GNAT superfamily N-acetyltransferase